MQIKPDRLSTKELAQLKWLMGTVLALLSLWALWSLQFGLELILLMSSVVVFAGLVRPYWIERIPGRIWRLAGPLILVGIVLDFALNVPRSSEFLPPLIRMVVVLLIYRTLAPRKRREDLQLILLCLFSVILAGVLTVSLLFAVQILLFMPWAMGLLFTISLLRNSEEGEPEIIFDRAYRTRSLLGRIRQVIDYKFLFFGAVLFGAMVVVSSFIFILMPRFNLEQAIPFLQISAQARSGFSSDVKLGAVSEIRADNSVALRVDVPSFEAMVARPYWRMLALDAYGEGRFQLSASARVPPFFQIEKTRVLGAWSQWPVSRSARSGAQWTFYLEGGISEYLPLPGAFATMRFSEIRDLKRNAAILTVETDVVQQSVLSYQLEDMQWAVAVPAAQVESDAFAQLTDAVGSVDYSTYPWTNLELSLNAPDLAYLKELNQQIATSAEPDAAFYGQRLVDYMHSKYSYTLRPDNGSGEGDEVVRWLRSGRSGHCEYFAGSAVLLARAAGYPARMVVGFLGGAWNSVEQYFVVRNSDAHAWFEIYDAKSRSWLRFDPTPGNTPVSADVPLARSMPVESGWDAWLDSLRIQWYRRVVNFDQDDQLELADSAKSIWDRMSKAVSERFRGATESIKAWFFGLWTQGSWWQWIPIAGGIVALWLVLRSREFWAWFLAKVLGRKSPMNLHRKRASTYMRKLDAKLLDAKLQPDDEAVLRTLRKDLESIRFGALPGRARIDAIFKRASRLL